MKKRVMASFPGGRVEIIYKDHQDADDEHILSAVLGTPMTNASDNLSSLFSR